MTDATQKTRTKMTESINGHYERLSWRESNEIASGFYRGGIFGVYHPGERDEDHAIISGQSGSIRIPRDRWNVACEELIASRR